MADLNTIFGMFRKKKIVLYGLGTETAKAIDIMSDKFNIVGLLDSIRNSGFLYGKAIIDISQCVNENVDLIIVVARPGSCKAIAKKIGDFCRNNLINVMDIRGKDLLNNERSYLDYNSVISSVREASDINGKISEGNKIKLTFFEDRLSEIHRKNNVKGSAVCIEDSYDIGFLFYGPIITDFLIWFRMMVKKKNLANIWFCARDGYLFHELYQMMDEEHVSRYFLTSRIAAIRSCVNHDDDITYIDSMKFGGTLEDNLLKRFGIIAGESFEDDTKEGILQYENMILGKAKKKGIGYRKYITSLNLQPGNIAFFDFVAKGTTQYFISRLVDNQLVGLYFLQLEPDSIKTKDLDIISFYTNEELEQSAIFEDYYILETFLTCSNPTVIEFDNNGCPVYSDEIRTENAIDCSKRVQLGIKDYYKKYIKQCSDLECSVDKVFDETFLKLIHNVEIKDEDFLKLIIEDPFFNRMTNITDLL